MRLMALLDMQVKMLIGRLNFSWLEFRRENEAGVIKLEAISIEILF